ncbi:MAG TPA: hypothetical protein VHR45_09280 [Thermoanaerobaculia bacterium]|nr:hypothetical protein [Thermoanaerobaculia bacterium]
MMPRLAGPLCALATLLAPGVARQSAPAPVPAGVPAPPPAVASAQPAAAASAPSSSSSSTPSSAATAAAAAAVPERLYAALRWRLIGPFRGGRVLAVAGVPGRPEEFYFGAVGGGVWKTVDAGRVWTPVFDGGPAGSIGAIAVAPSNPDVLYAGTGEADMRSDISFGDGVYKSTDGGRSWSHAGLPDTRQIGRILVDPHDAEVVLVAALGHGFGPNAERGVFRSADGGRSWRKVLYKDDNTGAIDLAYDPDDARTVYAALWNVRRTPWSIYPPVGGPGGGLYKSTDGGRSWRELAGHGLPEGQLGRIGVAVAAGQVGRRVYALIEARQAGLYRSDDAGESWTLASGDRRITGRPWYFGGVTVDPRAPDTVYVSNVSIYRSTDGGHGFEAIKGAPGGDDYHSLWIDPARPERMILGCDQGAAVSVDGASSWSSWYNQPTAQIYHVATDYGSPYFVFGAQQDSGTAAVASRSDYGVITFRDWYSVGTGESGYILPDPADPDVVFGGNTFGQLFRFSRRSGQVLDITPNLAPRAAPAARPAAAPSETIVDRYPWTAALALSPSPPYALYQGSQFLYRSTDRGMSWSVISPDLTERSAAARRAGKGVIYSIAPSPLASGQIWVGTDNGLIWLTRDEGRSWQEVTPPGLPEWSMISSIAASPFDPGTAYVAVDRHQVDDLRPYLYRTRDLGRSWSRIDSGIAANAYAHAIRPDPVRRGLLFAGTETGVYVSFDDGAGWQTLQLNLPAASVRDLAVKGDDLVAATHGRSFWILDDITPLRQLAAETAAEAVHLFSPAPAIRRRRSENRDTPLPPETPVGANPPAGAVLDYSFAAEPQGEVTLEIVDPAGEPVRKFSSGLPVEQHPELIQEPENFPAYWHRPASAGGPASRLPKRAGHNRLVWDLRYPPPLALRRNASIAAIYGEEPVYEPEGALVLPGSYQVRLSAGGQTVIAPLEVKQDSRVPVGLAALAEQHALEMKIGAALAQSHEAVRQLRDLHRQLVALAARLAAAPPDGRPERALAGAVAALQSKALALAGRFGLAGLPGVPPPPPPLDNRPPELTLGTTNAELAALAVAVGGADAAPTAQALAAYDFFRGRLDEQLAAWAALERDDLAALNRQLGERRLPAITLSVPR